MKTGKNTAVRAERLCFLLAFLLAALLTVGMCRKAEAARRAETQQHLAQEVLRFHVLANSDSEADQELKLKVRDRVLAFLEEEMPRAASADETADWVRAHIDAIEEVSRQVIAEERPEEAGADRTYQEEADADRTYPEEAGAGGTCLEEAYTVSAAVTTCWFPDRAYGDVTFPAGNYEALRIEIGRGRGHNWWCVLYPGLCFLDSTNAVMPDQSREKLKNVLTEEEYSGITADTDFKIRWFFWGR